MVYYGMVGSIIHHIVLTVSDVKKSTEFYKRLFGWKVRNCAYDFTEFTAPDDLAGKNFLFVIGVARNGKKPKTGFNRNNVGIDHFAFLVENASELKLIEKRLKRFKIPMEDGGVTDDGFGGTAVFCADPDGMKIEFHLKK